MPAEADHEIPPAPQIIHLQPYQQFTYTPSAPSTICIFPNQQPTSNPLGEPGIEDQFSVVSTPHPALENGSPTQAFATQTHGSVPQERVVRRKFRQYIQPGPFERDWQFRTYHGKPASITFRALYDTGCDTNLIPETIVEQLGYRDKIKKTGNFDLVSLAGTRIECIGEVVLPWAGRKKFFGSKTELVAFLVVPSSNTAITRPIIGADTLKTFGLLQTTRRKGRAFGAALRKFESKSKVSDEAAKNRERYAEMRAQNRQRKDESPQPTGDHMSQKTKNLSSDQTSGKL